MAHLLDPATRRPLLTKEGDLGDDMSAEHPLWMEGKLRVGTDPYDNEGLTL